MTRIGSVAIARLASMFFALLMNVLVARTLPSDKAGQVFWVVSATMLAAAICRGGFEKVILRRASVDFGIAGFSALPIVMHEAVKRAMLIWLALYSLIALSLLFGRSESIWWLVSAPSAAFFALLLFVTLSLQGHRRTVLSVFIQGSLVYVIFVLLFLVFQNRIAATENENFAIGLWICATGSTLLLSIFAYYKYVYLGSKSSAVGGSPDIVSHSTRSANWLWPLAIAESGVGLGAVAIASIWWGGSDIAVLSVAQRVSLLAGFGLMVANALFIPKVASAWEAKQFNRAKRLWVASILVSTALAMPILIALVVFPDNVLMLFGNSYTENILPLVILTASVAVNLVVGPVSVLLPMVGLEKSLTLITVPAFLMMLVAMAFVVPEFGLVGASICMGLGFAIPKVVVAVILYLRISTAEAAAS